MIIKRRDWEILSQRVGALERRLKELKETKTPQPRDKSGRFKKK